MTILEWRLMGPLDLSKSADWGYQTKAGQATNWDCCRREDLDRELCNACICQGILNCIHNWYQIAVAMDIELHLHSKETLKKKPKRQLSW
ncbi:hypothetical protein E2320_002065 [Naja naja]|nr:hypothetical protein E2320_002065 [Naja naja]